MRALQSVHKVSDTMQAGRCHCFNLRLLVAMDSAAWQLKLIVHLTFLWTLHAASF